MASGRPRILFVLQQVLGWQTYATELQAYLRERPDIDAHVLPLAKQRWRGLIYKRQHMVPREKAYRWRDPIDGFAGMLGHAVRAEIDRIRPDLVHFSAQYPAGATLSLPDPPPFTVTLDATRANTDRQTPVRYWTAANRRTEAQLLHRAARLFPLSRWAGLSAVEDYAVPATQIEIVPPCMIPRPATPRAPRSAGALPRLIFIGNDFRRKGGDRLHRWATGPLAGRCELHIVSADPAARSFGGANVINHGYVPHRRLIDAVLPGMDLLCHPTLSDMSAYVVVEAAFAGVPAVASRTGGIGELIEEDRTGWLRAPQDEAGFVEILGQLLAQPERVAAAGLRARAHALHHFDARANYRRMCDTLVQLAAAPDRARGTRRQAARPSVSEPASRSR